MTGTSRFVSAALAVACTLFWCAKAESSGAVFTGIGDYPGGGVGSIANGVSADGLTVVGDSIYGPVQEQAIRWTEGGGMLGLGFLPPDEPDIAAFASFAYASSADGSVIVGHDLDSDDAFRWTESEGMIALGSLPGSNAFNFANDVSDDGLVIVGDSHDRAFRWTEDAGMTSLRDLPEDEFSMASGVSGDGSVIVGYAAFENPDTVNFLAFRWTQDEGMVSLGVLDGGFTGSRAEDVSADGLVIVGDCSSGSGTEAFRWTEADGMVGLGHLPGGNLRSYSLAVSADGSRIVGFGITDSGFESFLWDPTHGMRNLQDLLIDEYGLREALDGWTLTIAMGISADGRVIVGSGVNPNGDYEGWVVRLVPEPSSWLLLLVGSTTLIGYRRWRD